MGAREEVLGRIRSALEDVPSEETSEDFVVPRDYRRHREHPEGDVERFSERVADYKATVERVRSEGRASAKSRIPGLTCEVRGADQAAARTGPMRWGWSA
jgi:L-lactate dehydrogenase complex protein LldG